VSYNKLRDKRTFSAPEFYETLDLFLDKTLTLTAQSNNLISVLNLETSGAQVAYFMADRIVCTKMSVFNGPISQVGSPELSHQAANKDFVDNRFPAYTTTEQVIF
jgi:hypothetical protein